MGAGGFQCGLQGERLCLEFAEPRVQLRVAAGGCDDLPVALADSLEPLLKAIDQALQGIDLGPGDSGLWHK